MWIKKRHKLIQSIIRWPFKWFVYLKYRYTSKVYKLAKKPYLVLANHLTTLDPLLVSASINRPVYYIASAYLFSNKFSKLIKYVAAPIPKNKNVKEMGPIKDALRIVKDGGIVGLFPEGNRSYSGELCYIDEAIAKFVKLLKVDVIFFGIYGGYGIDPRWCYKGRKGKSYGAIKSILTKEDASKMSIDELFKHIKQELTIPSVPNNIKYKSKRNAEGLERVLYLCPICHKFETIKTNKNQIICSNCGLDVTYNNYLAFETTNPDFKFKYVKDWYFFQENYIKAFDINTEGVFFQDSVSLYEVANQKLPVLLHTGTISMNKDRLCFDNEKEHLEYPFESIKDVTVLGKHKLNFYINNTIYQIKGDKTLNTLKYMHMYYHIKNIKGGIQDEFMGM